ncbi:MAG: helix-turn-helix domain-containing protein [Actinomycetota bacterium]
MRSSAIRTLRRKNGWTQAELAERLGTDPVTVSRWERAVSSPRPSARMWLKQLAEPVPLDLSPLVDILGEGDAERLLRRAMLLARRPGSPRFAADPTRRLRELERARREQTALKKAARVGG